MMRPTSTFYANMAAGTPSHRKRVPLLIRASFCALLILGATAAALILFPDTEQRSRFSDLVSAIIDILAAVLLVGAARESARRSPRLGLAWGLLALAGVLYAAGDTTWLYLEALVNQAPFPSLADAFYLAYYPIFLAGVI